MVSDHITPAAVAETHVSTVFFTADRAYKLKKPVRTAFLNFSTREQREAACRREVELNRRLAPDVYLGVATVTAPDGQVCDHLVVMRRLPDDRRLATLVAAGEDLRTEIRDLARLLAAFHSTAATDDTIAEAGRPAAIRAAWLDNLDQMAGFRGQPLPAATFDAVKALALEYVDGRAPLFEDRAAAGFVRDGHGDLLADDIFCMPDGLRILDCIEFDDRLRYGDVVADVAFLGMDLERLGRPDLALALLADYSEFSGEHHPTSLAHHYVAARALVRAKVACIRHQQGAPHAASEGRRLLSLAHRHLRSGRTVMVLVGGLPGTGKSTLASALSGARGWSMLRSDVIRKEQAGLPAHRSAAAPFREGLYSRESTAATYEEMLRRAAHLLSHGTSVVLDASWIDATHREAARAVGTATHSAVIELECDVPRELADEHIAARLAASVDASDATPAIAGAMEREAAPWPEATRISTSGTVEQAREDAERVIDASLDDGPLGV